MRCKNTHKRDDLLTRLIGVLCVLLCVSWMQLATGSSKWTQRIIGVLLLGLAYLLVVYHVAIVVLPYALLPIGKNLLRRSHSILADCEKGIALIVTAKEAVTFEMM